MIPVTIVLYSPLLRRLFDHWRGLAPGAGALPAPRALDPLDVP
jgi:hypothetical protein